MQLLLQEGILSRNRLSRKVYANWSGFFGFVSKKFMGARIACFQRQNL
jgi:poly(A) polymerase Pap1